MIWLVVYLIGYILSYLLWKVNTKRDFKKWTIAYRNRVLLVSIFSLFSLGIAIGDFIVNSKNDKPAKW